jgi:voltage-gated potassium channel
MQYNKFIGIVAVLLGVYALGVCGYTLIEGWPLFDSLYMTVITLSTVGYGEVHSLSHSGRIFTIFLIIGGTGVLVYGISSITAFVVEGELTDVLRRKKMQKKIDRMKGHFIVCGADQTGKYVIEELVKTKQPFVVIEMDTDKIKSLCTGGVLCVEGNATHNAVLQKAGIQAARGLMTTLHSDAENLLVVFTAKRLNPALKVISKAFEEESEQKIRMAGADGVVMPNFIGGMRMVSEMIRPSVVSFLDIMLREKDRTIRVEEVGITAASSYAGRTLAETDIAALEGVTLVALKRLEEGKDAYRFNPAGTVMLSEGSILVLMGTVEVINTLKEKAQPSG